ncbi:class I SAM-dependent methyltransferase [Streptomyces purpurogeneiscleroticus]|uniref:class I SAM-dependent methyltransferase n=1 Tax=Streptomyces purpurogeneiscleroticus TaxID=68259 RepID=UPI001CBDC25F|nr:class I SAM-dependent methyltransferase [Streptomyces purpurogeneiscleroticus]MBZ4015467.1 SAM-dependent methyltransferase [Streptomyces purpurogeneiscleroticus]
MSAEQPQPPTVPSLDEIYGEFDLSHVPAFAGGFINFGYWADAPTDRPLTEADRIGTEKELYRLVLRGFDRTEGRDAAEVGCGLGLGSALALCEYGFGSVVGLDVHPEQVRRAQERNAAVRDAHPGRLEYRRGAAERLPLPDASVECLFSVEAAQHFPDIPGFARETARVLRAGGRLALTTFFATGQEAARALPGLLPTYADGLDLAHVADEVAAALEGAGLSDVRIRAIGESVWAAYDRYLGQVPELRDLWPRRFLTAYEKGLLDYYVITADRPETG